LPAVVAANAIGLVGMGAISVHRICQHMIGDRIERPSGIVEITRNVHLVAGEAREVATDVSNAAAAAAGNADPDQTRWTGRVRVPMMKMPESR
jgi:hypothetical protein